MASGIPTIDLKTRHFIHLLLFNTIIKFILNFSSKVMVNLGGKYLQIFLLHYLENQITIFLSNNIGLGNFNKFKESRVI